MGKMNDRRRRATKAKNKLKKRLKSLDSLPFRKPTAKAGWAFKSKKDYDRKQNKKIVDKEMSKYE